MNLRLYLYIFFKIIYSSAMMLELEPAGVLYVCSGGPLTINCSTNTDLLEWNITVPILDPRRIIKSFQRGRNELKTVQIFNNILHISLIGEPSPLISTLYTDNATADLNGSLIVCSGFNFIGNDTSSGSVKLNLVGRNGGNVNITSTVNISERFEISDVSVTLEWSTKNGVSYNVNVGPQVAVNQTRRNSVQLTVPYNIKHNVSVVASLCGTNRTTFSVLHYVKCPELDLASRSDSPIRGEGYRNPAIEGTIITLSCPPGLILTGSNISTCMRNGEWEPDTKGIKCKVDCDTPVANNNISLNYSSTLENSLLTFQCKDGLLPDDVFTSRCYRNRSWIPNPSSHACATSSAANCDDPSPPSDGYLEPYTSTIEGTRVNRVHMCQNGQLSFEEIICSADGEWESVNGRACSGFTHKSTVNFLAIISGSLGSLLAMALFVCGILIVVITVILRKKATVTAVSSSGEQKNEKSKHHNPEYEEVMGSGNEATCNEPEELEMMQNVAYGPLQLR